MHRERCPRGEKPPCGFPRHVRALGLMWGGANITDTPNMVFGGITVGLIPQSHGTWPNQATTRSRSAQSGPSAWPRGRAPPRSIPGGDLPLPTPERKVPPHSTPGRRAPPHLTPGHGLGLTGLTSMDPSSPHFPLTIADVGDRIKNQGST